MKLTELKPEFALWQDVTSGHPWIRPAGGDFGDAYLHTEVGHYTDISVQEAQGLLFNCPKCNPTHGCMVGFRDRDLLPHHASQRRLQPGEDPKAPRPSRWEVTGTGFHDLTLKPSIDTGCWHGYITNGEVINA